MKNLSLIAAGTLILLANGLALTHAARNRSGEVDSDIVLTNRELPESFGGKENNGRELRLNWQSFGFYEPILNPETWLNRAKLAELGFDCRMDPAAEASDLSYRRQRSRRTFVALEFNGTAWQTWRAWSQARRMAQHFPDNTSQYDNSSQLVIIDAAPDAAALRRRHPDRRAVMILPAAVRIGRLSNVAATGDRPAAPARLTGYFDLAPAIHLPRPFSDHLPAYTKHYRVHLRVGQLYDPFVTAVEITGQ